MRAYDEQEEAGYVVETIAGLTLQRQVEPRDVAVMYRTNAQSRALEEAFLHANLPYRLVGAQRFYGRREVKDLIAYLRLVHNPADQVSLMRVLEHASARPGCQVDRGDARVRRPRLVSSGRSTCSSSAAVPPKPPPACRCAPPQDWRPSASSWPVGGRRPASLPVADLIDAILDSVRYRAFIDDGTEEGEDRWANVLELRGPGAGLHRPRTRRIPPTGGARFRSGHAHRNGRTPQSC